ncbi:hypothetical protein O8E88_002289 [Flavobacterium psychrophilum]|uniref:hypothetical protein n=1 Tax=Flavobacterium psychrophilum TaxID=96345 RepID=UPI0008764B73|nr:hypothetical protein [Flavobacterium psychrophilum]EKT2070461.1 hypothetical protein [Flavobacterium psychrophilum]EKT2072800.1 hypothetical protein [Flavobacterium psychrophilum]EKT4492263.1 hypothetical protein [Flavobacterium psychrophilum]MBF2045132.1 hypothetical protein [Flavobacterium psychrophilum]SCY38135.1 hypothetical protein SAMN02745938_12212 [Flavobacterium psychrophilum DSM 3660] [Flavobacterium psychrophilum DSM 3660 = ATCC 49418]
MLVFTIVAFGQNQKVNNIKKQSTNNTIIKSNKIKQNLQKGEAKIYIVKEKSETDYSKYIISLISLLLGIFINKMIDWWNDKSNIKKAGERWIIELRSTEEPIKAQITELERFTENLKKTEWELPNLSIFSVINGDVFKSLDKNELVKYIESKNSKPWYKKSKVEDFKKIIDISNTTHGHIGILVHQFEMLKEKWESLLEGISKTTSSYNKNLQQINHEILTYSVALAREGIDISKDEKYKPLFDLYLTEVSLNRDNPNFNPLDLEEKFFKPVVLILGNLAIDERIIKLATTVTECFNDISAIKAEKKYMISNCTTLIERYKKQLIKLNPLINRIEGETGV